MQKAISAFALIFILGAATICAQEKQNPKDAQDPAQDTIKIGTTLITVPVIVTDRFGRFATGLKQQDFTVREDGKPQDIAQFSSLEEPFNVVLLIDTSRSTIRKLGEIQKAAQTFIKQLQPRDRVMVITFDERVNVVTDFTGDARALKDAVKKTRTGYYTRLYDAIHYAVTEKLAPLKTRKAIVVLTDGVDTASKQASYDSSLELIASAGIITYAIQFETRNEGGPVLRPIYLPPGSNSFVSHFSGGQEPRQPYVNIPRPTPTIIGAPSDNEPQGQKPQIRPSGQPQNILRDRYLIAADYLRALTALSGARYFRANTVENTTYQFMVIAEELRHQYTLAYVSNNDQRDGSYRAISVRVNNDELAVRARQGYRVPKAEPVEAGVKQPGEQKQQ